MDENGNDNDRYWWIHAKLHEETLFFLARFSQMLQLAS